VRIEIGTIDSGDGASLVDALLADLRARYDAEDIDEPAPSDLVAPRGVFLVAYDDGTPVGCGGVRTHADGIGELKRMYVVPAARRRHIARRLLEQLEVHALALGYRRLRLETGVRQPEAIALYESAGYRPIPPYGHYHESPMSRCFEKALVDGAGGQGTSA
jgi:GNAT superfamily N-acetyltransferase